MSTMNNIFNLRTQADLVLDTFLVVGSQNGRHAFSSLDGHRALFYDDLAALGRVGYHSCHRLYIGQVSSSALLNELQNHQLYNASESHGYNVKQKMSRNYMESTCITFYTESTPTFMSTIDTFPRPYVFVGVLTQMNMS